MSSVLHAALRLQAARGDAEVADGCVRIRACSMDWRVGDSTP
jgi:hypothetical protein